MLGQDLIAAGDTELTGFRNLRIGFVFAFHKLLPDFTAFENVIFPTAVREGRDLLVRMRLEDRINLLSAKLSGGQKQRVAVARALMNAPELVLADEPKGNPDRAFAMQVMELIDQINRVEGTTFLISIHDEKIANLDRRQIVMGDGVITGWAMAAVLQTNRSIVLTSRENKGFGPRLSTNHNQCGRRGLVLPRRAGRARKEAWSDTDQGGGKFCV